MLRKDNFTFSKVTNYMLCCILTFFKTSVVLLDQILGAQGNLFGAYFGHNMEIHGKMSLKKHA